MLIRRTPFSHDSTLPGRASTIDRLRYFADEGSACLAALLIPLLIYELFSARGTHHKVYRACDDAGLNVAFEGAAGDERFARPAARFGEIRGLRR
jgi:hypothetical protein